MEPIMQISMSGAPGTTGGSGSTYAGKSTSSNTDTGASGTSGPGGHKPKTHLKLWGGLFGLVILVGVGSVFLFGKTTLYKGSLPSGQVCSDYGVYECANHYDDCQWELVSDRNCYYPDDEATEMTCDDAVYSCVDKPACSGLGETACTSRTDCQAAYTTVSSEDYDTGQTSSYDVFDSCRAQLPDLKVEPADATSPTSATAGDSISMTIKVKNVGAGAADASKALIQFSKGSEWPANASSPLFDVTNLNPGSAETTAHTWEWRIPSDWSGDYTINFCADYVNGSQNGAIEESDETNCTTKTITISQPACNTLLYDTCVADSYCNRATDRDTGIDPSHEGGCQDTPPPACNTLAETGCTPGARPDCVWVETEPAGNTCADPDNDPGPCSPVDAVYACINRPAAPTVTFSASPLTINYNGTTTLTWASTNATSCAVPNDSGWTFGARELRGSWTSPSLTANTSFSLSCSGSGGTATATPVTVTVNGPPTVANPATGVGVTAASTELTITTANPLLAAVPGRPYRNLQLQTTGGTGPLVFATSGLPDGLTINPTTGEISGTFPTNSDDIEFTVTVTDSATPANTATKEFTIAVRAMICTDIYDEDECGTTPRTDCGWVSVSPTSICRDNAFLADWKPLIDLCNERKTPSVPPGLESSLTFTQGPPESFSCSYNGGTYATAALLQQAYNEKDLDTTCTEWRWAFVGPGGPAAAGQATVWNGDSTPKTCTFQGVAYEHTQVEELKGILNCKKKDSTEIEFKWDTTQKKCINLQAAAQEKLMRDLQASNTATQNTLQQQIASSQNQINSLQYQLNSARQSSNTAETEALAKQLAALTEQLKKQQATAGTTTVAASAGAGTTTTVTANAGTTTVTAPPPPPSPPPSTPASNTAGGGSAAPAAAAQASKTAQAKTKQKQTGTQRTAASEAAADAASSANAAAEAARQRRAAPENPPTPTQNSVAGAQNPSAERIIPTQGAAAGQQTQNPANTYAANTTGGTGASAGAAAGQQIGNTSAGAVTGQQNGSAAAGVGATTQTQRPAPVAHGAYIQGRTGPGILLYPVIIAAANGLYYLARKRRR